jgi:hypothetical protein
MARAFTEIAFTPSVKAAQEQYGSRHANQRLERMEERDDSLTALESEFIQARDGFYQATVSETGWPYVQFRGGPPGFARTPDASTIAWADFRGNQQFVTAGNVATEDRVALFFMDYPGQRRLKVYGHLSFTDAADEPELATALAVSGYRARIDRIARVRVAAWDRNCPQHIPQRYTIEELTAASGNGLIFD